MPGAAHGAAGECGDAAQWHLKTHGVVGIERADVAQLAEVDEVQTTTAADTKSTGVDARRYRGADGRRDVALRAGVLAIAEHIAVDADVEHADDWSQPDRAESNTRDAAPCGLSSNVGDREG